MEQEGLFTNAIICPETSLVEVRVDGLTFQKPISCSLPSRVKTCDQLHNSSLEDQRIPNCIYIYTEKQNITKVTHSIKIQEKENNDLGVSLCSFFF